MLESHSAEASRDSKKIEQLERDIQEIKKRNLAVEANKAWETSTYRKILVALFTYLAIGIFMWSMAINRPWLNAIVPTLGFLLSTLTLPWFKQLWIKKYTK